MKAGGGKGKGSAFERRVCKDLSLWVSKGKREDLFWRSAMSGGRSTVRAAKGKLTEHQSGDISSVHPAGHALTNPYYLECKFYRDLNAAALVFKNGGTLAEFWKVACKEAARYRKEPMLILKQNQQPIVVGLQSGDIYGETMNELAFFPQIDLKLYLFADLLRTIRL